MAQRPARFPVVSRRQVFRGGLVVGGAMAVGELQLLLASGASAVAAPSIASCATWGAQGARGTISVLAQQPTKILVHHTATSNSTDYSLSHAYSLARSIQQAHFDRGWIDTGQQFTISRGGYVLEGRHQSLGALQGGTSHVVGAHCTGQNDTSLGIENEGTYTSVGPTAALYDRLVSLCAYMCQQYAISSSAIFGHRDFYATACPGDVLYAKLPQLRSDVASRLGGRTWPLVRSGDTGERVRTVQYLLRQAGYSVSADGVFGSGTESAVRSFQQARGLAVDGVVGTATWERLAITVRNGSTGDAVRGCQSQLRARGYAVNVDGVFGAGTESAVRSFQQSRGLGADGIVGLDTWSRLVA